MPGDACSLRADSLICPHSTHNRISSPIESSELRRMDLHRNDLLTQYTHVIYPNEHTSNPDEWSSNWHPLNGECSRENKFPHFSFQKHQNVIMIERTQLKLCLFNRNLIAFSAHRPPTRTRTPNGGAVMAQAHRHTKREHKKPIIS